MTDSLTVYLDARFETPALREDARLDLHAFTLDELRGMDPEDLRGANVVVAYFPALDAAALADLADHGLAYVVRHTAGYGNVDVAAATDHGVVVTHAPQGPRNAVAEAVVGMMISCGRHLHVHNAHIREEGLARRFEYTGVELRGSVVGVLGLGLIGRRLAEYLDAFGADVRAHDPYVDEAVAADLGVDLVDLDSLVASADFLSIHTPLTEETHHMLGAEDFRRMKDTAYVVNAARGGIYPDAALAEAIEEGWIAGAAVDVFEDEDDVSDNPLLALDQDQALLTPHSLGSTSRQAKERIHDVVVDAVTSIRDGECPPNVINPEAHDGPVPTERRSPSF